MKRSPLLASFILFIALCASIAYWAMQLFKPPLRPVAALPALTVTEAPPDAAASLFGGHPVSIAVFSNFQLKGVVVGGDARESVAILSTDGKPPQVVRTDAEAAPGVTVKEVQPHYVILSEGGVSKRLELPISARTPEKMNGKHEAVSPQAPPNSSSQEAVSATAPPAASNTENISPTRPSYMPPTQQ